MGRLNLTEYQPDPTEFQMYYCSAILRHGFYIENGDERFYHFMGKLTCYAMTDLIHPEDVQEFLDAAKLLEDGPQHLLMRLKNASEKYKWVYAVLYLNSRMVNDQHTITMELCDIMAIKNRYQVYNKMVRKYRQFMTLSNDWFMEYSFSTDELQVYEYVNGASKPFFKGKLEETYDKVQNCPLATEEQRAEFQVFYEHLKKGTEHFLVELDETISVGMTGKVRYCIRANTMYEEDEKVGVVGLVSAVGERDLPKAYYMSDNAIDSATGILNKRAIHEYAVEKIQGAKDSMYLAILDVDDFKQINDRCGHQTGDEVLAKFAEIIKSIISGRGRVGRFGGDEFMLVLDDVHDETTLRRILSTIKKHASWAFGELKQVNVTYSCGVSRYPDDGQTYDGLFEKADKCLYIAKDKGKDRYIIYDEQKHGFIEKADAQDRTVGLKAVVSDSVKNEVVSELILKLSQGGKNVLLEVMEQMQIYFDIDGIAIYQGENLLRTLSLGKYVNPILSLEFALEEDYVQRFDTYGFFMESSLNKLESRVPRAVEAYQNQETKKVIQFMAKKEGRVDTVVSFDFFNRAPKQGTVDLGLMKIVGRLMAKICVTD
ncbi:MAG: GGDEF domain-containing protein [Lachnospiraceae bacterium]|nr:GGDEF domain-containing protein [Lachnospiraceae bacterium]